MIQIEQNFVEPSRGFFPRVLESADEVFDLGDPGSLVDRLVKEDEVTN